MKTNRLIFQVTFQLTRNLINRPSSSSSLQSISYHISDQKKTIDGNFPARQEKDLFYPLQNQH